jgi:hypothetical protein
MANFFGLVDLRIGIIEPCRPWLSWVGLHRLWHVDAFRTECTGAITHPLKGNSVFSERESLLNTHFGGVRRCL